MTVRRRDVLKGSATLAVLSLPDWFPHRVGTAPTLILDTTTQNNTPQFTLIVPIDVSVGGVITYQSSTSPSFSSPVTTTRILTLSDVSSVVAMGASALGSNGTYYYRAQYNSSPWSNTVTLDLSVPTEPTSPTFISKTPRVLNNLSASIPGRPPMVIFYDMDIGYPASDRTLIVCPAYWAVATDIGPSATVIGGGVCYDIHDGNGPVAMTMQVKAALTGQSGCSIWYANVPTGNLADIITCNSDTGGAFDVVTLQYGIAYGAATAPTDSASVVYADTPNPLLCPASPGSIKIRANGFALALSVTQSRLVDCSWSAPYAVEQSIETTHSTDAFTSQLAQSVTVGSSVATLTKFATSQAAMCVAAWGP